MRPRPMILARESQLAVAAAVLLHRWERILCMACLLHVLLTDRHYVDFATLMLLEDSYPIAQRSLKLYRSRGRDGGWGGWAQDGHVAAGKPWRILKGARPNRRRRGEADARGLRSGSTWAGEGRERRRGGGEQTGGIR